jgi:hypothetical protein
MTLSNGPAANPGQPPRPARDGEPSPFAPKWAREGRHRPRTVVSLHQPMPMLAAPFQIGPSPAAARPLPIEPSADETAIKRLLPRHPFESQLVPMEPLRDPLGLALGMIARLMVAGSAAAAVAMLLIGAIPMPFRPAPATTSAPPYAGPGRDAAGGGRVVQFAPGYADRSSGTDMVTPPPTRVATVSVRPATAGAQASAVDQAALGAGEVDRLVKRGEDYLAQGDVAAARLVLGRAAEARDARATLSLASSYDPAVLTQLHVLGVKADIDLARTWYEKAVGYGSAEASRRLATLPTLGGP